MGSVLLKRKKLFLTGRTMVSYLRVLLRKLLSATSYCAQLMLRIVWEGFDAALPSIWSTLRRFLADLPAHVASKELNDDSVGSFNFQQCPPKMILDSLDLLIKQCVSSTGVQQCTVDLRKSAASGEPVLPQRVEVVERLKVLDSHRAFSIARLSI